MEINEVSGAVVRAAMKVHSALGPGLLESVYRACLAHELRKMGLTVDVEWPLPILYDGVRLDVGHRIDLRVQEAVIVETKSVARFASVHEAQLLSYLKMSGLRVGLLINFNVVRLRTGIRRMVN
jgi:GxxExxY protein